MLYLLPEDIGDPRLFLGSQKELERFEKLHPDIIALPAIFLRSGFSSPARRCVWKGEFGFRWKHRKPN